MKRTFRSLCVTGLLCGAALAQTASELPRVIRIYREDIKEGKYGAHEKTESNFMQAAAKAKYPAHILGMTAMTGPNQAWFLEEHDSFASVGDAEAFFEKSDLPPLDMADAELRTSSRSLIVVYRPDLSYRTHQLTQRLPKARFVNMIMVRVKPGMDQ